MTSRNEFTDRLELFKTRRLREVTVQRGVQVVALDVQRAGYWGWVLPP